jgi:hypothetical protein
MAFNDGWTNKRLRHETKPKESIESFLSRGGKIIKCPAFKSINITKYNFHNLCGIDPYTAIMVNY